MPIQVDAISSWMSPWFQAKLWFERDGMNAQAAGVAQLAGLFDANKNQSGSANGVNVGVRAGSAVIMWSVFISVLSASATMMLFSTWFVYGFSQCSCAISRSRLRVFGFYWFGLPVLSPFGAALDWSWTDVWS